MRIIGITGGVASGKSMVANQFAALGAGVLLHLWSLRHGDRSPSLDLRRPLAWPALAALLLAVLLFAPLGTSPFIYLRF